MRGIAARQPNGRIFCVWSRAEMQEGRMNCVYLPLYKVNSLLPQNLYSVYSSTFFGSGLAAGERVQETAPGHRDF